MCHQTVSLVQKFCEENYIACSMISIIDEITIKLNPKRFLSVPYSLGFPLGEINQFEKEKKIVKQLLKTIQ